MPRLSPCPSCTLALCLGLLAGGSQAATDNLSDDPVEATRQDEERARRDGSPADARGAIGRGGGLIFAPRITMGARYDDNIYATPDGEVADLVFTLNPELEARSQWASHALTLRAGASVARYQDYASEDTEDYWLEAKGRHELSRHANLFGGVRHAFSHEDRESADDLAAATPTTYRDDSLYGGLLRRFADGLSLRIGGSYRQLDYDHVANLLGQTNDDRDREVLTGALRLAYELGNGYQWFTQGSLDQRRYRLPRDDNGYHRDSSGYRLQTGLAWRHGGVQADVHIGHMGQDYDASSLSDVSAVDFGSSLTWRADSRTTVRLAAERSIEETTQAGASSYLWTTLNAGVSFQLQPKLSLSASAGMMEADYQGTAREDDFMQLALGAKYEFDRHYFLSASYRFLSRDSSDDTVDFDRNQLALVFGARY